MTDRKRPARAADVEPLGIGEEQLADVVAGIGAQPASADKRSDYIGETEKDLRRTS